MKPSIITRAVTLAGFALGAFALAAVAAGTWSAPTQAPPNGNVDAPINVGSSIQTKTGGLVIGSGSMPSGTLFDVFGTGVIGTLFSSNVNVSSTMTATNTVTNTFALKNGSGTAGYYLQSTDTKGTAKWVAPPSKGSIRLVRDSGGGGISGAYAANCPGGEAASGGYFANGVSYYFCVQLIVQ